MEALEAAIRSKDPAGVVAAVADWNEEQREAARRPLAVLLLALGIERTYLHLPAADLDPNGSEVAAKRKRDGIQPMSRKDKTYDYEMAYIAWLAAYGIADRSECERFSRVPDYEAESAQIMADRRPPWLDDWLEAGTSLEEERLDSSLLASFWSRLYQHKLVSKINEPWVEFAFSQQLPDAFDAAPEAVGLVMREVPAARNAVYQIPKETYQLTMAKSWVPVVEWLGKEKLLDHGRLLTTMMDTIHGPLNQTERNGCVMIAKAASKKSSKCPPDVLEELQSRWIGLLSDSQAAVAGFGLEQLILIEKAGKLNAADAVIELPGLFQHKPKTHAKKAVEMLGRIASDESLRGDAVRGLAGALLHPAKEIQEAAIAQLAVHLHAGDEDAIEAIGINSQTVAATLRPKLKSLLESVADQPIAEVELPAVVSEFDAASLRERAKAIPMEVASRFRIAEALTAWENGEADLAGDWRMNEVCILNSQEPIQPIETVEELVSATSAAVEHCESPDTPDRIVDGICRLAAERPDHFEALTKSLASRACADVMERPNRGIVGGLLGDSFSQLIGAWLEIDEEEDDDFGFFTYHPLTVFLKEVADRVREHAAYPLLSAPTHHGGWIDPVIWVRRLEEIESRNIDFLESDLTRSLLRLAPDRRETAWRMVADQTYELSPRFRALAEIPLNLARPSHEFQLDDTWSAFVWITAIRARDPWIDLEEHLPKAERAQLPEELWKMPDVLKPADYQWSVLELGPLASRRGLIETHPMRIADGDPVDDEASMLEKLAAMAPETDDISELLGHFSSMQSQAVRGGDFLTGQLHYLPCFAAPAYYYPYQATQWPMKLDWYWSLATVGLSRRVESGTSVEERYDLFLLPLFDRDRPVSRMAARAIWVATVSKDDNARSMAVEVWIAIISDDRANLDVLASALEDVFAGQWMKINRIAEVFTQVAQVSPAHALVLARILEAFLSSRETLPRDAAKLLEVLDECNEGLGRAAASSLRSKLETIKRGKAKKLAESLLEREDSPTTDRNIAIGQLLKARVERAERS